MMKNHCSLIFRSCKLFTNSHLRRPIDVLVKKYIPGSSYDSAKFSIRKCSDQERSDDKSEDFDFEPDEETMGSQLEELYANDPKMLARLKHVRLLVCLLREKGQEVPQQLSDAQWVHLLSYEKKGDQTGYLSNLYRREKLRKLARAASDIGNIQYQKLKKIEREEGPVEITTSGPVIYQLRHNTLFHRVLDPTIDRFYNYKLLQATMFATTVIVDCGFESRMKEKEIDVMASRMAKLWGQNRYHVSPFNLEFCDLNPGGRLIQRFREYLPYMDDPAYPFFYTAKSYMELYPPERLVYLSSDAHRELNDFNGDNIFILGGLGNHAGVLPLTKMKAQRDGIRAAKFPTKRYNIKMRYSSLDVNTVLSILNDWKETSDWIYAFRHIDDRKYLAHQGVGKVAPDHSLKSKQRLGLMYDVLLTRPRYSKNS